jgi:ribulose kinase
MVLMLMTGGTTSAHMHTLQRAIQVAVLLGHSMEMHTVKYILLAAGQTHWAMR